MTNEEAIEVLDDMIIKIDIPKSAKIQINKNDALAMGIKALEKQTPKKPKCYEDKFIECSNCGIGFGYKWECYPTKKNDYSHIQYCFSCGTKIDWSEGEAE